MRPKVGTVERELARIARRQHGLVTRAQLVRARVTDAEIKSRVANGALLREHRGVYRVGHRAASVEARYLAAVLACGAGAVLSGCAAAHLLGLLKGSAPPAEVITRTNRRVRGVRTHRARRHRAEAMKFRGIPVTTVPRTLVDLAAVLDLDALARACHEAGVLFRTTPRQVEAVLRRRPTSPGAANLRAVMRGDAHVLLSKLEQRFLHLLREARLPLPKTNRPAGGRRVDCRWPDHRLTVELDSYTFHRSRHAWEQDRRREREAYARADTHRRYTHGDVFADPRLMMAELRGLLSAGRR